MIKKSDMQKMAKVNSSDMNCVKECHPKQIISDLIPVPIWKVEYRYTTQRNNNREAVKYVILGENGYDLIDSEFMKYIEKENNGNPNRKVSNVEILDTEYIGEIFLELE